MAYGSSLVYFILLVFILLYFVSCFILFLHILFPFCLRQRGYSFIGVSHVFVCLLAGIRKTTSPIFTEFTRNVAHEPQKKPLDSDGNLDHVTLGLG